MAILIKRYWCILVTYCDVPDFHSEHHTEEEAEAEAQRLMADPELTVAVIDLLNKRVSYPERSEESLTTPGGVKLQQVKTC
jgi:predicted RNase H-like HicB family nuclease